ncbi:hypothetical protein FOCC_FOCC016186 [Frankliniella occidentalis]|nr:hypothetical protein FOCC_FOCC016186 [Frankliniella occidentalis]
MRRHIAIHTFVASEGHKTPVPEVWFWRPCDLTPCTLEAHSPTQFPGRGRAEPGRALVAFHNHVTSGCARARAGRGVAITVFSAGRAARRGRQRQATPRPTQSDLSIACLRRTTQSRPRANKKSSPFRQSALPVALTVFIFLSLPCRHVPRHGARSGPSVPGLLPGVAGRQLLAAARRPQHVAVQGAGQELPGAAQRAVQEIPRADGLRGHGGAGARRVRGVPQSGKQPRGAPGAPATANRIQVEGEDLVVHFNLRFDPYYGADVRVPDLLRIMHTVTINATAAPILDGLQVDPASLLFREEGDATSGTAGPRTSTTPATTTTTEPPPPRRCAPVELDYCRRGLPYNATSYPNVLGHKDYAALREDVIAFRELVDAECYRLAFEFVCQALQPECVPRPGLMRGPQVPAMQQPLVEDLMVPPCRSFCRDFMAGCGSRVPQRFREALQCSRFPEYSGPGSCADRPGAVDVTEAAPSTHSASSTTPAAAGSRPGNTTGAACLAALRAGPLAGRVCDGVPDCADLADEADCGYCPRGGLHCGLGGGRPHCVHQHQRCDAKHDCPGGSDEKHCCEWTPTYDKALNESPHSRPPLSPPPSRSV